MIVCMTLEGNGTPTLKELIEGLEKFEEDHGDKKVRYDGCLGGFSEISVVEREKEAHISITG